MVKYLFINSVAGYGSTGKLIERTARSLMAEGNQCTIAYGRILSGCDGIHLYRIGGKLNNYTHALRSRLLDQEGFGSVMATKKLLKWMDSYTPDVVWLHNLHGYYINIELLFAYLKIHPEIQVKITLHDCWLMTGHCPHFMRIGCDQWKTRCKDCVLTKEYPKCIGLPNVKRNHERKEAALTGLPNA